MIGYCANNEDQAMRPLKDIIEALEQPHQLKKMKKFFLLNKEEVMNRKTKSMIKGRTNSPKGKDGLRSEIVYFNEIHQYKDYLNINVFTTGLGKRNIQEGHTPQQMGILGAAHLMTISKRVSKY